MFYEIVTKKHLTQYWKFVSCNETLHLVFSRNLRHSGNLKHE